MKVAQASALKTNKQTKKETHEDLLTEDIMY